VYAGVFSLSKSSCFLKEKKNLPSPFERFPREEENGSGAIQILSRLEALFFSVFGVVISHRYTAAAAQRFLFSR
jgi:hypothetical protein